MRKGLLVFGFVVTAMLAAPVAGAAANSPAQIVNCAGSPPWCFSPNPIRITAGSTITWTNSTSVTHTATSTSGAWDTGDIGAGQTSSAVAFNSPGTFSYRCSIHQSMTGTVIVTAAATTAPAATARPTTTAPLGGLARSGGGSLAIPIGAALALAGIALLAAGALFRRQRHA